MKKILIIFLLLFSISSCNNNGWEDIAEGTDPDGGKFILALDRSDIADLGNKKTAWVRKSFASPKKLKSGETYQETYIFFAVNCKDKKYSIIELGMTNPGSTDFVHTIKFSENIDELIWSDVPDREPSITIYDELCVWYKSII